MLSDVRLIMWAVNITTMKMRLTKTRCRFTVQLYESLSVQFRQRLVLHFTRDSFNILCNIFQFIIPKCSVTSENDAHPNIGNDVAHYWSYCDVMGQDKILVGRVIDTVAYLFTGHGIWIGNWIWPSQIITAMDYGCITYYCSLQCTLSLLSLLWPHQSLLGNSTQYCKFLPGLQVHVLMANSRLTTWLSLNCWLLTLAMSIHHLV